MKLKPPESAKDAVALARLQTSIIQSVMTATVRVDGGRLRTSQDDRYEEMLASARAKAEELRAQQPPPAS